MRAANSVFNEARIVAQLRKTRDMQIQAQLALGDGVIGGGTRARHVTVTEERICGVCHKRLGGSVINVFPEYVSSCCTPLLVPLLTSPATRLSTSVVRIEFLLFGGSLLFFFSFSPCFYSLLIGVVVQFILIPSVASDFRHLQSIQFKHHPPPPPPPRNSPPPWPLSRRLSLVPFYLPPCVLSSRH